jgi:hypothetical protein
MSFFFNVHIYLGKTGSFFLEDFIQFLSHKYFSFQQFSLNKFTKSVSTWPCSAFCYEQILIVQVSGFHCDISIHVYSQASILSLLPCPPQSLFLLTFPVLGHLFF